MSGLATSMENLRKVFTPIMAVAPEHEGKSIVEVETRFGTIEFERGNILTFPKGIPGFQGYSEFGLTKLPVGDDSVLVLLQSIEPNDLAFFVCSYEPKANLIDQADLILACEHLGIAESDCAIVVVANFHKTDDGSKMSVNLRAPILIDVANRLAWQYILPNDAYQVRHILD